MTGLAVTSVAVGCVLAFILVRRGRPLLVLAGILMLISLTLYSSFTPANLHPGDGVGFILLSYLIAPTAATGLVGGAIFAWLLRDRTRAT
ncbi:hypothetical protein [uncultured Tateyamaria sp.]|uniref:hypothetical protein n=1 Tax=uncultured Tateyamaria sp. TaxID=455651 RepID=UPI002615D677|nr:hypothetical protein [uncultured Tateyamaria sp.]